MKQIVVNESTFNLIRANLIVTLGEAMLKREQQIKSGEVTGMAAYPAQTVCYHVESAFREMEKA